MRGNHEGRICDAMWGVYMGQAFEVIMRAESVHIKTHLDGWHFVRNRRGCLYEVLMWGIHMGYSYGVFIWDIHMGSSYGVYIRGIHMGYPYGVYMWGILYRRRRGDRRRERAMTAGQDICTGRKGVDMWGNYAG